MGKTLFDTMSTLSVRQQVAINDVMDSFDFDQVEAHMKHVNWGWNTHKAGSYIDEPYTIEVPDIDTIKKTLRSMLTKTYDTMNGYKKINPDREAPTFLSCGGFTIYVWPNDICQVFFSVTDWWVDDSLFEEIYKNY